MWGMTINKQEIYALLSARNIRHEVTERKAVYIIRKKDKRRQTCILSFLVTGNTSRVQDNRSEQKHVPAILSSIFRISYNSPMVLDISIGRQ